MEATPQVQKMLRLRAVLEARGCSKSKLYQYIAAGVFPPPVKIGPKIAAWPESDLIAEQRARIAERDRKPRWPHMPTAGRSRPRRSVWGSRMPLPIAEIRP